MLTTHGVLNHFDQNNHRATAKSRRVIYLTFLLATLTLLLTMSWPFPGNRGNQRVLAANSSAEMSATLSSQNPASCLQNVDWPLAFEIPFSMYFAKGTGYGPWHCNLLRYEYLQTPGIRTARFKSEFSRCPNLPGVPLSFFGQPCEFYFLRNPQNNNQYDAYVYSTAWQKYFLLASNFGPLAPDFVARYQALLPSCLSEPLAASGVPVGNPPNQAVNWFLTSGTSKNPAQPQGQGYYAAIATPVTGPDGNQYKPPYSFNGAAPGVHDRTVYGQLVYDWKKFAIKESFPPEAFTPPEGYAQIKGTALPPAPRMNCEACHITDLANNQTFYAETRRTKPK